MKLSCLKANVSEPAPIDEIFINNDRYKINNTLIDQIYLIPNSYEHINLKFYNYYDIDMLVDYLNTNAKMAENHLFLCVTKIVVKHSERNLWILKWCSQPKTVCRC